MSSVLQIIKRNGETVSFDPTKIFLVLERAFKANGVTLREQTLQKLVDTAVTQISHKFVNFTPNVENVQDIVERVLMKEGYYEIAKAYILYRRDHAEKREKVKEVTREKIKAKALMITKSNGQQVIFEDKKIRTTLRYLIKDLKDIDVDLILEQLKGSLFEGMNTKELARALIMTVRAYVEHGLQYSKLAARLVLHGVYKDVIGEFEFDTLDQAYRKAFIKNLVVGVEHSTYSKDLLAFDLTRLSKALRLERDFDLAYLGMQTLTDRYFVRDLRNQKIIETPQTLWMRVAMGLTINEENKNERAIEFYETMSQLRYVPSTPTLFQSGTKHPQLSSCYLTTIEDDLDHIFKSIGDNARLSKWSGGIGNDWTNLRATGALVKKTGINSNGIVPFLKIADVTTAAINRSGRRRGATCAYLATWHMDIEDFLELRKNTGDERRRTPDMNTSNWIPDLFMKRMINNEEWTLFSPDETPDLHHLFGKAFAQRYEEYEKKAKQGEIKLFKTMKARDLWRKMLTMLYETGHPWLTFKDPCNIRSPQDHVGVIHSSNLCTEITLNTSFTETAVCNLGSVNLSKHIKDGKLDVELISQTVTTAMRMLDNVIDINYYPTVEAKNSNLKHRPVGLGVMGFQDALYQMGIAFDSDECVAFSDESQELVSYHAILASSALAKERGSYMTYIGSKWDRGFLPVDTLDLLEQERGMKIDVDRSGKLDWAPVRASIKAHGMRNSNCMAIAPTATISNISGVFPTIEPIYKNLYVKANQAGDFTIVNQYLIDDLKGRGLWTDEIRKKVKFYDGNIQQIAEIPPEVRRLYKEVFEIEPQWIIKAAAYRGKWIDQSQSLNVFFKGTSGKILAETYQYAWMMGLKTTYYLRTLAASQVEKSTLGTEAFGATHKRGVKEVLAKPEVCPPAIEDCEACQ